MTFSPVRRLAAEAHGLTVGTYLQQWLEGKRGLRSSTRRGYESHIRLYLKPYLGQLKLVNLRPHHLDCMYAELLADPSVRGATTVRRVHATIRSALNTAVRRRLIPWNPALHVELPSGSRKAVVVWSPEQLGEFLISISDHRLYALFHLVAVAGLRRGEVLGLRWKDVDLDSGVMRVEQQLIDTGKGLEFGPPKTRNSGRSVALDHLTVEVLRGHQEWQQGDRQAWGKAWVDSGLVFTRENGERLRPDYLTHLFQALIAETGLPRIRLHGLRHTSASLALAADVPMKVVSDRLGHSTTTITADLYTHVVPTVAREAAERIGAMLPRRRPHDGNPVSSEGLAQEAPKPHRSPAEDRE